MLSLDSAVQTALSNNEQIVISQKKVEAARAKVSQAFSGYLPSLSLSANYSRNFSSPMISEFKVGDIDTDVVFGFNEPSDSKSWQASLSQNLFTFGKLENRLSIALESVRSAEQEYRKTEQDVICDTVAAYFNVVKSKKALLCAAESYEMAKAHLAQAEILLRSGRASNADHLRNKVALLSAEQELIKAETSVKLATAAFNSTIGAELDEPLFISDADFKHFKMTEQRSYDQITEEAYMSRPELKQARSALKMSENALNLAKSNWLPSVAGQASYGWNNTDYSSAAVNFDQTTWTLAAGASWKLFDGFDTQSRIKEASAALEESRAALRLAAKATELELKQAYLNHFSARKVAETAEKALEVARDNFEASRIRYRNGVASNIELLDAQSSLTKAELALLSAEFDLCLSAVQLKKTAGTLKAELFTLYGKENRRD